MNYYSMHNHELAGILERRGLLTPQLSNELNRFYGVEYVTPQEVAAKNDAIKILEADDKHKPSIPKSIMWGGIVVALLASTIEIVKTGATVWHHYIH